MCTCECVAHGAVRRVSSARNAARRVPCVQRDARVDVCVRACAATDAGVVTASHPNVLVVSGPNMGGKSTYVRMAAVAVVLAQAGCFVPAVACRLRVFDGVYTRMGAREELSPGASSFLEEMGRAADILRAAGPRSLVVLDELGR